MPVKPPKKSLAILHTEASLGWGGQERRILVEALAMRQRGHRPVFACDPRGESVPAGPVAEFPGDAPGLRRDQKPGGLGQAAPAPGRRGRQSTS